MVNKNDIINFDYIFSTKEVETFINNIPQGRVIRCYKCHEEITGNYYFRSFYGDACYNFCPKHYRNGMSILYRHY